MAKHIHAGTSERLCFDTGYRMMFCILTGGNIDLSVGSPVPSGAMSGNDDYDTRFTSLASIIMCILTGLCYSGGFGCFCKCLHLYNLQVCLLRVLTI